jgi:hypothetical protein
MGELLYSCVQLVHNIGAAAVVGSPAVAWWLARASRKPECLFGNPLAIVTVLHRLAWFTAIAWITQILSGIGFAATTYHLKHELPELTGIGLTALGIKITCALISIAFVIFYLKASSHWSVQTKIKVWQLLFMLGLAALVSAAFLRWYG